MQEDAKTSRKIFMRYLAVTVFCLIVSIIYSFFSHGIHSFWMRYLALWPLLLGTLPAFVQSRMDLPSAGEAEESMKDIYRFGLAAVTVASFLKGVLEIAGTDSLYPGVLLYAGAVMLLCGAVGRLIVRHRKKPDRPEQSQ